MYLKTQNRKKSEGSGQLTTPGAVAAAKKWRGLINIHDLDCTMLHARIFERVANAAGTLTATAPSIRAHMRPYRVARMLNQLRHDHRV